MAETERIEETKVEEDYIAKINELKANTVPKADFDKLREDNRKLLDSIVNGQEQAKETPKEDDKVDIQALRNELYGGKFEGTDLEYMAKTLALRKAIMDNGDPDPGVCNGVKTVATEGDYENCAAVCDLLQEVVDYANGDPQVFRAELMRRVKF